MAKVSNTNKQTDTRVVYVGASSIKHALTHGTVYTSMPKSLPKEMAKDKSIFVSIDIFAKMNGKKLKTRKEISLKYLS